MKMMVSIQASTPFIRWSQCLIYRWINTFYPSQNSGSECRKRIDAMLNALDERELKIVEATIQAMKASKETEET